MTNKLLTLNCSDNNDDKINVTEVSSGILIELEVVAMNKHNAVSLSDEDGFKLYNFLKGRYAYD